MMTPYMPWPAATSSTFHFSPALALSVSATAVALMPCRPVMERANSTHLELSGATVDCSPFSDVPARTMAVRS
jgi:hypothetical protein